MAVQPYALEGGCNANLNAEFIKRWSGTLHAFELFRVLA